MQVEEFRAQARAEGIGPHYSGLLHFGFVNGLSLAIIAFAALQLRAPRWSLVTVPITFLYANLVEWLAHRGPMHRPRRFLRLVYQRLHLGYHLGERAPRFIERLRRHHALHHDPQNMNRNFNITFPICDRMLGTRVGTSAP